MHKYVSIFKRTRKMYLETNKNGNTTYQSLQCAAKTVVRGNFIVIIITYSEKRGTPKTKLRPQGNKYSKLSHKLT